MTKEELIINLIERLMGDSKQAEPLSSHPAIGQYVIVRTYSAGVHAGTLAAANGCEATLTNSRRIWKWGGDCLSLSEVSQNGIDTDKSQVACVVPTIYLTEAIEIIPCSIKGKASIEAAYA